MRRRTTTLLLALAAPTLAGWQGAGEAPARWWGRDGKGADLRDAPVRVIAVGRLDPGAPARAVMTVEIPGDADAVLDLEIPAHLLGGGRADLPAEDVRVTYVEFAGDGTPLFRAVRASGPLVVDRGWGDELVVDASLEMADGDAVRGIEGLAVAIAPVVVESPEPAGSSGVATGGGAVVSTDFEDSGCDDDRHDSGRWSDGSGSEGCEGDDYGDDSDSGCEGDDTDSSSDWGDDSGGCEGDDTNSSDGPDCDGDAIAGTTAGGRARSPLVARLVGWLPWMGIFLAVRVMRRRERRYVRRPRGARGVPRP